MKFLEFNSISNLKSKNQQNFLDSNGLTSNSIEWMATEKVHGANMSIYCDGENISYASRSGMVGWLEQSMNVGFFNADAVVRDLSESIKKLAKSALNSLMVLGYSDEQLSKSYVVVYGELYGGSVQKKMPYGESQKFIAFDFVIVTDDVEYTKEVADAMKMEKYKHNKTVPYGEDALKIGDFGRMIYVPPNKLELFDLLNSCGIDTVPVLMKGTYNQCASFDVEFPSTLTDHEYVKGLKLTPEQELHRVASEGIVIEPVSPVFCQEKRIVLKKRSTKFEEFKSPKAEKNYSQKLLDTMNDKTKEIYMMVSDMVCENRFESTISKIGEVSIKDFNKVQGLMFQDILQVVSDNYDGIQLDKLLDKEDFRSVKTVVMNEISNLIRPLLIEM